MCEKLSDYENVKTEVDVMIKPKVEFKNKSKLVMFNNSLFQLWG